MTDHSKEAVESAKANQAYGEAQDKAQAEKSAGSGGSQASSSTITYNAHGDKLVNGEVVQFASQSNLENYRSEQGYNATLNEAGVLDKGIKDTSGNYVGYAPYTVTQRAADRTTPYNENYGYSGGVKVSPIVQSYSKQNPDNITFELSTSKPAKQAREAFSYEFEADKGGVVTPESKDKSFGWSKVGKNQFTRDSGFEIASKESEAKRAEKSTVSFANPKYSDLSHDETFGGPATPQSKALGSKYGAAGKGQLYRDTSSEFTVKGLEEARAKAKTSNFENTAFLASPNKGSSNKTKLMESPIVSSPVETKPPSVQAKNISIDLFENVGIGYSLTGSGKVGRSSQDIAKIKAQQKELALNLFAQEKPGVIFEIKDKQGKLLETTSGQRTRYDFLKATKKYGEDITISPKYDFTPAQFYEYSTKPVETAKSSGSVLDVFRGFGSSLYSAGGSIIGLSASIGGYGLKEIESLKLEKGQVVIADKTSQEKTISDIKYGITYGIKPSSLLQGKIEFKESPSLTHRGETIVKETSTPTNLGANLGSEKPIETKEYYLGTAFGGGALLGAMAEGAYSSVKPLIPFRITTINLPYEEGVKPYSGLTLGYEGSSAKYLIGKAGGKTIVGQPTGEELQLGKLSPTTTRYGFESASGKPIVNKIITDVVTPELEKSGRISKVGALDITETGKEGLPLAVSAPTIPKSEGFGEKPFRNLTSEQGTKLLELVKENKFTVTGSTAEIPFTKTELTSQARDIDIKGVSFGKASKFNEIAAGKLNELALPGQKFEPQGTKLVLFTKSEAGTVNQEKIVEFPQHNEEKLFGESAGIEQDYVFGLRLPTGKSKVGGIKVVEYNYQGMRKIASSTEFHVEKEGGINIRAATGREVKDPAHVYSFYKTKAENYFKTGNFAAGKRLDVIAENYRSRHPELDFSQEFKGRKSSTLFFEAQPQSKSISAITSSSTPVFKSSILGMGSGNLSRVLVLNNSNSGSFGSKNIKGKSLLNISKVSKFSSYRISKSTSIESKISKSLSSKSTQSKIYSFESNIGSKSSKSLSSKTLSMSYTGSKMASSKDNSNNYGGSKSNILSLLNSNLVKSSSYFGKESITSKPITSTNLLPKQGNFGIKRKNKLKEGPTRIFAFNVRNVFSSNLDIKESGGLI